MVARHYRRGTSVLSVRQSKLNILLKITGISPLFSGLIIDKQVLL
jgi:hypothetical protein